MIFRWNGIAKLRVSPSLARSVSCEYPRRTDLCLAFPSFLLFPLLLHNQTFLLFLPFLQQKFTFVYETHYQLTKHKLISSERNSFTNLTLLTRFLVGPKNNPISKQYRPGSTMGPPSSVLIVSSIIIQNKQRLFRKKPSGASLCAQYMIWGGELRASWPGARCALGAGCLHNGNGRCDLDATASTWDPFSFLFSFFPPPFLPSLSPFFLLPPPFLSFILLSFFPPPFFSYSFLFPFFSSSFFLLSFFFFCFFSPFSFSSSVFFFPSFIPFFFFSFPLSPLAYRWDFVVGRTAKTSNETTTTKACPAALRWIS